MSFLATCVVVCYLWNGKAVEGPLSMSNTIKLTINGFEEQVAQGSTLLELVSEHGDGDVHLIVERNGRFVYPDNYETVVLEEGDRTELINPNFGG